MFQQDDVSISYLPLAHMFERMIQVVDPLLRLFFFSSSFTVCLCVNPKLKSISGHRSRCSAPGPELASTKATSLSLWTTLKLSNLPSFLLCLVYSIAFMTRSVNSVRSFATVIPTVDYDLNFLFLYVVDPGFCELSVATGFASLRREEKAGRAQQRSCT